MAPLPHKTHLIDRAPWWAAAALAVGYVVAFLVCVGVGAGGPAPVVTWSPAPEADSVLACADVTDCTVSFHTRFTGLSGYNQVLWMAARLRRPADASRGNAPALAGQAFAWPLAFAVDAVGVAADGSTTVIAANVTHTAQLACPAGPAGGAAAGAGAGPAGGATCGGALVFLQTFLRYREYDVTVRFDSPYRPWVEAGIPAANLNVTGDVGVTMYAGTLAEAYTRFQVAGKYTFFTLSVVMFGVWLVQLWRGRGASDPRTGHKLQMSADQVWVTVLAFLLMWYNDPTFIVNVTAPSFAASGFYAFDAVTFIAVLLLYWLVQFDSARTKTGELGSAGGGMTGVLVRRCHCSAVAAGLVFWIPKVLWVAISWVLVLGSYMVSRAAYIADPAFSFFETFPLIRDFFYTFITAWAGIYVVYLGILLLMACYNCRVMLPSGRYVLAITFVSIIAVLVGYFMNGLLTVNASNSSVSFMAAYGAVNCYVWFLMFAYMPVVPPTVAELNALEAAAATPAARAEAAAPYGGDATAADGAPLKAAVDAVSVGVQTDLVWLEGDAPVVRRAGRAPGGGGAAAAATAAATDAEFDGGGAAATASHVQVMAHVPSASVDEEATAGGDGDGGASEWR